MSLSKVEFNILKMYQQQLPHMAMPNDAFAFVSPNLINMPIMWTHFSQWGVWATLGNLPEAERPTDKLASKIIKNKSKVIKNKKIHPIVLAYHPRDKGTNILRCWEVFAKKDGEFVVLYGGVNFRHFLNILDIKYESVLLEDSPYSYCPLSTIKKELELKLDSFLPIDNIKQPFF